MRRRHRPKALVGLRKFFKSSQRFQLAFLLQEDAVAIFDSTEPMRDEDDGDFMAKVVHGFHHGLFGEVIQRANGFVED